MKRFVFFPALAAMALALSLTWASPAPATEVNSGEIELPANGEDDKSGLPGEILADPDSFGATDASAPVLRGNEAPKKTGPWGGFLRSLMDFMSVLRSVEWFRW